MSVTPPISSLFGWCLDHGGDGLHKHTTIHQTTTTTTTTTMTRHQTGAVSSALLLALCMPHPGHPFTVIPLSKRNNLPSCVTTREPLPLQARRQQRPVGWGGGRNDRDDEDIFDDRDRPKEDDLYLFEEEDREEEYEYDGKTGYPRNVRTFSDSPETARLRNMRTESDFKYGSRAPIARYDKQGYRDDDDDYDDDQYFDERSKDEDEDEYDEGLGEVDDLFDDEDDDEDVGNYWSNPRPGLATGSPRSRTNDGGYSSPRARNDRWRKARGEGRNGQQRRRTTFRSGRPSSPATKALGEFYDKLFLTGIDGILEAPLETDKTKFGGTRGKFDGLKYLEESGFLEPSPRRPSKRRPRKRVSDETDDGYFDDEYTDSADYYGYDDDNKDDNEDDFFDDRVDPAPRRNRRPLRPRNTLSFDEIGSDGNNDDIKEEEEEEEEVVWIEESEAIPERPRGQLPRQSPRPEDRQENSDFALNGNKAGDDGFDEDPRNGRPPSQTRRRRRQRGAQRRTTRRMGGDWVEREVSTWFEEDPWDTERPGRNQESEPDNDILSRRRERQRRQNPFGSSIFDFFDDFFKKEGFYEEDEDLNDWDERFERGNSPESRSGRRQRPRPRNRVEFDEYDEFGDPLEDDDDTDRNGLWDENLRGDDVMDAEIEDKRSDAYLDEEEEDDEELEQKELEWETVRSQYERVPPNDVAAWGPSGELGIDARTKAALDALEDIQQAKKRLEQKNQRVEEATEDLVVLRA